MGPMARGQAQDLIDDDKGTARFAIPALMLGNILLAFGPVFVRLADVGPVASGFWRIALAVPFLFFIAWASGDPVRRLPRPLVWIFIGSGLFFAADLASWHIGILQTKLANANLLGNSTSFLLPLYAFAVSRSLPSRMQGIALALALAGTALLVGRSFELSREHFIGDLLCVLAGVFYTGYLILMAKGRDTMGPWPVLAWSSLVSALPLLIIALVMGERIMPTDWTPLLAMAFSSQIAGQGLMIYAIGRVPPVLFGLALLLQPLVAAMIGWLAFDEGMGTADWIGAALIATALILVREPEKSSA